MNSEETTSAKPVLRILHQMARSGGTVICRCLGSMRDVVLLSEIHPAGRAYFDPLQQAHEWHGLLTEQDILRARTGQIDFATAIALIDQRARDSGKILLLRDWSAVRVATLPLRAG